MLEGKEKDEGGFVDGFVVFDDDFDVVFEFIFVKDGEVVELLD